MIPNLGCVELSMIYCHCTLKALVVAMLVNLEVALLVVKLTVSE
jgi:hypothetical protein